MTQKAPARVSGHDDFVLEAAGGDDQQERADGEKGGGINPEMNQSGAAKDDAASDVDEIGGGNEIAENEEEFRHGFARENIAGEKDAGKNREEGELHGFGLGIGFAGDEDAQRERHEDIGKRKRKRMKVRIMQSSKKPMMR